MQTVKSTDSGEQAIRRANLTITNPGLELDGFSISKKNIHTSSLCDAWYINCIKEGSKEKRIVSYYR